MVLSERELKKMVQGSRLTEFQKNVLIATMKIPKGSVKTYKQIAKEVGNEKACRAVGTALSKNPFAPYVPCHRVVRGNGDLGNYSGRGGRAEKRRMLFLEGAVGNNGKLSNSSSILK